MEYLSILQTLNIVDLDRTQSVETFQQDLANETTDENCCNQVPEDVNLLLQTELKYEQDQIDIKEEPLIESKYVNTNKTILNADFSYDVGEQTFKLEANVDYESLPQVQSEALNVTVEENIDELKTNIHKDFGVKTDCKRRLKRMEKRKLAPINSEQKRIMVEYLRKHPNLAKQRFSKEYTLNRARKQWEELSHILNSVPGSSKKNWVHWRKTWTDIKKNTKNKNADVRRFTQATDGEPQMSREKYLTGIELEILEIIGNVPQKSDENINESPVEFDIVDLDENNLAMTVVECVNPSNTELKNNASTAMLSDYITTSKDMSTPEKNIGLENDHSYSYEANQRILDFNETELSASRILENSQKAMMKTMDSRSSTMEEYYKKKSDYFEHLTKYHEQKLAFQEQNNEVLKQILSEIKIIKTSLFNK